jgi:RecG-like helicase
MGILRREVAAGHQGYIVYPVIEESKLDQSRYRRFERLKQVFRNLNSICSMAVYPAKKRIGDEILRKNETQILSRQP